MTPPKFSRPLIAAWLAAVVFLCAVYFDGLRTWFYQDDFAWLSLLGQTHSFRSLLHSLFEPAAQGTMRFLSERAFFLIFERIFGFYNLPWRIAVFLTAAADLALITWLCLQATGSRLAAGLAPFFWVANAALVIPMSWDSAYNEVLCPLFLMAALALFDRYLTTGRRSFWWWQMVVFTLGFGVLEINTVYPAIAAVWLLAVRREADRRRLVSLIPGIAISVAYFVLHQAVAPAPNSGPYALHIDSRLFSTLATYWKWSLVSAFWSQLGHSPVKETIIVWVESAVLLAEFLRRWAQGRRDIWFFAAWFLLTLGPMLPLPNHLLDYYLTIPGIGLALFAATAIADAMSSGAIAGSVAIIAAGLWLFVMLQVVHIGTRYWFQESLPVRALVLGADAAKRTHPGKAIVIEGLTDSTWARSFPDSAFTRLGVGPVYLTPDTADRLRPLVNSERLDSEVLEPGVMRQAITHSEVVIYSIHGDHLRNITSEWARLHFASLAAGLPRRVDAGSPLYSYLLDPRWLRIENGARRMPSHAALKLAGPAADDVLVLDGFHSLQRSDGIEHLSVTIDGIDVGSTVITRNDPDSRFHRLFNLPSVLTGRDWITVEFAVDPVLPKPEGAETGLFFGTVALKKGLF